MHNRLTGDIMVLWGARCFVRVDHGGFDFLIGFSYGPPQLHILAMVASTAILEMTCSNAICGF